MNNENGENYKVSEAESKTTESKNKRRSIYNEHLKYEGCFHM